jgi:hypothetical protein
LIERQIDMCWQVHKIGLIYGVYSIY